MAGITHFESTLGGIGGQPANFVDGVPVTGTGAGVSFWATVVGYLLELIPLFVLNMFRDSFKPDPGGHAAPNP